MAPQDIYSSLQKGVIDGAGFPAYAVAGFKLQEVIRYFTRPVIGQSNVAFMMNAKKFDSLPPKLQKALMDVGAKIEQTSLKISEDLAAEDSEVFDKASVKVTAFSPSVASNLQRAYIEAIHANAVKAATSDVEAFFAFAKAAKMLAD
jgi:TRAP-type C4-dicarboxylate transport system substrate-binding protein